MAFCAHAQVQGPVQGPVEVPVESPVESNVQSADLSAPLPETILVSQSGRLLEGNQTYWAVGASSSSGFLGNPHPASITLTAVTGGLFVQGNLSIASLTGGAFGIGVLLRTTVWGDNSIGLHMGGGMGISTVGPTEVRAIANGGIHFILPQLNRLMFIVDGGLTFGSIGGGFAVQSGALSPSLGIGVSYFLGES